MSWLARTVTAGLVIATCCACGVIGGDVTGIEQDERLTDGLRELSSRGGTARLAELTDLDWDTVHVFGEGARAEDIEQTVGQRVIRDKRYYDAGNLLVFVRDGEVVSAVSVVPDLLSTGGQRTWGADTRLEPTSPSRPAVLRMVEP